MQNKHDSVVFLTLFQVSSKDQQRACGQHPNSNEVQCRLCIQNIFWQHFKPNLPYTELCLYAPKYWISLKMATMWNSDQTR